jgi:hypothetical protein
MKQYQIFSSFCILIVSFVSFLFFASSLLHGQDKVIIVRHGSTPEGDIIRARADAILALKQAQLIGEKAVAQRLENMLKECDVAYKQFATRNQLQKEALENKFNRTFDIIKFNQQLTEIRNELEHNAVMQHTRIGDPTEQMNYLLEKITQKSFNVNSVSAMKTELSPEQLDAIYLNDGSNTFSAKTGKIRIENFRWPFWIQRKEFKEERDNFETICDKVVKEVAANNSPTPETVIELLKMVDKIDKKIDEIPMSEDTEMRLIENKWRKEAKLFIRELKGTLGNCSKLDSEKLSRYIFQGKTLGDLIAHMNSNGLRFSQPNANDANLYASIFFIMRYSFKDISGTEDSQLDSDAETRKIPEHLIGSWDVTQTDGFHAIWIFKSNGDVDSTRQPNSKYGKGRKFHGIWTVTNKEIHIQWDDPKFWDSFILPIDPKGVKGNSWKGLDMVRAKKIDPEQKK